MEVYDTVIIGGGPTGLICADKLGSAGMNVLLIEKEESEEMKYLRKYNRYQLMTLKFLIYAGPLRGLIHGIILMVMKNRRFKAKINRGGS